jgi:hypothetical protein
MLKNATYGFVALVLAVMVLAPAPAAAYNTTYIWNGGTGNWNVTGNWSPNGVPSGYATDTAEVTSGSAIVNLTGSTSANRLVIGTTDEVRMVYGGSQQFTFTKQYTSDPNPTLVNDGVFRLADTGGNGHLYASYNLAISGSGRVIMETSGSRLTSGSSRTITNGAGHTIEGVGTIEPFALSNSGTVQATGDKLVMLRNFYNNSGGVLSSNPGAVLQMGSQSESTTFMYHGNGGWLDLKGGTVRVETASFENVNIRSSGAAGASMDILQAATSVSFNGNTNLESGVVLNFNNATMSAGHVGAGPAPVITNDGIINLTSTGTYVSSFSSSDGTLTGSGKLVMSGSKTTVNGGFTTSLTNDVNHTIEGQGSLGYKIVNNGTILANNGNLEIKGQVSGNGQVKVQNGGKLVLTPVGTPATSLATLNLLMSNNAGIQVGYNCSVSVAGNFSYAMTNGAGWSWNDTSYLYMTGAGSGHFLEVGGVPDTNPYTNNFLIPNLIIAGDTVLADFIDNQTGYDGPEALYVKNLSFTASSLNLNNLELYYWNNEEGEFDLAEVGDFDGRVFNQEVAIPVPGSLLLLSSGLLGLGGWRFRQVFSTTRIS